MPELPEVETTVKGLKKTVLGRKIEDVWSDTPKMARVFKKGEMKSDFSGFRKEVKGKKILEIGRRGKNILFFLSEGKILLVHLKMTGHFLFGKWRMEKGRQKPLSKGPLTEDPMNRFIRVVLYLGKGKQLALCDLRKFAKMELWDEKGLKNSKAFSSLGPEPLSAGFSFKRFKDALKNKKGRIKQVLMDQTVIAGIGNIYSDEALFAAKIHPLKKTFDLKEKELERIYLAVRKVLKQGIDKKGESFSDFRTVSGEKGGFDSFRRVYRREGEPCFECKKPIKRIKIGGRSSCFCPRCQPEN
jgi:formamidopyrimidine-DNA glycosylase